MAQNLVTTDLVAKETLDEFLNAMTLVDKVDRQWENKFKKVGDTIDIRRPVYFEAIDGATLSTQDIEEGTTQLVLAFRKHVAFSIPTQDLTLEVEELRERYFKPAGQELLQQVESSVADLYKGVFNFVGTPGTPPSDQLDIGAAQVKLDDLGVPMNDRNAFWTPNSSLFLANGLRASFPTQIATRAIEMNTFGMYGGFNNFRNQSLRAHTVGNYGGVPLVDGAAQNVTYDSSKFTNTQTIITDGWDDSGGAGTPGTLTVGDIITFDGVESVNRRTRESTGNLSQHVITVIADVASGGGSTLTISPPLIIDGPYQTVTAAPANDAPITILTGAANSVHRQNLGFHKNAFTLATAKLEEPKDANVSSAQDMGVSIRVINKYDITSDSDIWRFDILYGVLAQNPGFAVRITE